MNVFPIAVNELGLGIPVLPAQGGSLRTQAGVFEEIFFVFLLLGTLVGLVVIAYTIYNVYKYRWDGDRVSDDEFEQPVVGQLPIEEGGGKKLFLSFGISAIIVISLIIYAYGLLLAVENPNPEPQIEDNTLSGELEITVEGYQFGWRFTYPNGHTEDGTMYVPDNHMIWLSITSADVWHNFGVSELRIKDDAIPGDMAHTWFTSPDVQSGEEITYVAECYELCGVGHSYMTADIIVVDEEQFNEWYAETNTTEDS